MSDTKLPYPIDLTPLRRAAAMGDPLATALSGLPLSAQRAERERKRYDDRLLGELELSFEI